MKRAPQEGVWSWAPILGVAAAAVLMLFNIDSVGLSGDEGFTAQMVRLSWATMLSDLRSIDYNMSLHYLLLKGWGSVFGFSETAIRIPSVLAVLGALLASYRLVARLLEPRAASLTVLFIALNPFVLVVGITARPYAFLLLWTVLASAVLVSAVDDQLRSSWMLYGLLAVVGLHVHLLAALVIAAHATYAIIRQRGLRLHNLYAAMLVVIFGVVPTLLFLAPSNTLSWIGEFTLGDAASTALTAAGGSILGAIVLALSAVGLGRAVIRWRQPLLLFAVWLAVPSLAVLALAPIQSLFVDIYFAMLSVPLAALAALGLHWLMRKREEWALPTGVVLAGIGLGTALVSAPLMDTPGWRELPRRLDGLVMASDLVAFPNPYYRIVAEYYTADSEAGPYPPGQPLLPDQPWGSLRPYQLDRLKRTEAFSPADLLPPGMETPLRIWLVGPQSDAFNRAAARHLEQAGYRLVEVVDARRAQAALYEAG